MRFALVPVVLVALAACEGDSNGPTPPDEAGEITVDASSTTGFAYVSLEDGEVVTVTDPATSTAWDIALRRFEVRLNGGVSGGKGVVGYNLRNHEADTPEAILALTPENTEAEFEAVGEADIPATVDFLTDGLVENGLGWLSFGPTGPAANPGAAWKVQTAGGNYAVVRATGLTIGGTDPQSAELESVDLEWRYQPAGGALGAVQTATIDLTSGNTAIDLATGAGVTPAGCNWDLQAGALDFSLTLNAACTAGSYPIDQAVTSLDEITDASDASEYGPFLAGRVGAVPFTPSLDDGAGPFLYNLAGDNRLSPTFNIYLIKVGDAVYKVQLTGYYSDTGASGHPTIRYARIR